MKKTTYFLLFILLVGVFYRLYNLGFYIHHDEAIIAISSMKFFHQSYYDGLVYVREHPPFAKMIMGIPSIFIQSDYTPLSMLGSNMYVYAEFAEDSIRDNFIYMRLVNALFGILSVYMVYKLASFIKGRFEGIVAASITSISLSLLTWSKMVLMDSIFLFFFLLTIYLYFIFLKKKNIKWLIMLFISITITLGTRNMHPIILVAALSLHYFIYKRKINYLFYFSILLSLIIVFLFVYPPFVAKEAISQFGVDKFFFQFGLFDLLKTLLFKHSLLITFVFLVDFYLFFKLKMYKKLSKQPILFILIAFFIFFSVTPYGNSVKYCFVFIPLMSIIFSKIFLRLNIYLKYTFFSLLLLNSIVIFQVGGNPTKLFDDYSSVINATNEIQSIFTESYVPFEEKVINYLDEKDAVVLTNSVNLLIFYNRSYRLFPIGNEYCSDPIYSHINYVYIKEQQYSNYFCDFVRDRKIVMRKGQSVLLSIV